MGLCFAVSMSTKKISTNIFEVNRSTEARKVERMKIISVSESSSIVVFVEDHWENPSVVYYLSMFVSFMVTSLGTIRIAPMNSSYRNRCFSMDEC